MKFTADDLKYIKDHLDSPFGRSIGENCEITRTQLVALLARLEAAEKVSATKK